MAEVCGITSVNPVLPCPVSGTFAHSCKRKHRSAATQYQHLCECGHVFHASPYEANQPPIRPGRPPRVVECTTCTTCNGWGMLYDGKARPRVLP